MCFHACRRRSKLIFRNTTVLFQTLVASVCVCVLHVMKLWSCVTCYICVFVCGEHCAGHLCADIRSWDLQAPPPPTTTAPTYPQLRVQSVLPDQTGGNTKSHHYNLTSTHKFSPQHNLILSISPKMSPMKRIMFRDKSLKMKVTCLCRSLVIQVTVL